MPTTISEDPPQKVVIEFNGPPLHRGEADSLELLVTPAQAESLCHLLKQHNSMCVPDQQIRPVNWTRYAVNMIHVGTENDPFWDMLDSQVFEETPQ
jgi:hypothetical protein